MGRFLPDGGPQAVARLIGLIETVARAERPPALADLAVRLGLPKSTAHRLTLALAAEGILTREPGTKRFGIGSRLAALAVDALTHSTVRGARHAVMQSLVDRIGETCNLTMLDGAEVLYLDRVEAAWPLRMHLGPGSHVPLHCTASGKLFLALLPAAVRRRIVGSLPLAAYTRNTLTDPRALEAALVKIRRERVGIDNEEFLAGLIAIAVPVKNARGKTCAAIAVHAPTARLTLEQALGHLPKLRAAAAKLALTLVAQPAASAPPTASPLTRSASPRR